MIKKGRLEKPDNLSYNTTRGLELNFLTKPYAPKTSQQFKRLSKEVSYPTNGHELSMRQTK